MININSLKKNFLNKIKEDHLYMVSMIVVNGGNYLYNLLIGRILGPKAFADAAILITFLLVLSFVGMTFQIVTTKYSILYNDNKKSYFIAKIAKIAFILGIIIGILFYIFSNHLQLILHTQSDLMFKIFGFGIPVYFLMSVNRGVFQSENKLFAMSLTYQSEMLFRLIFTILLLLFFTNLSTTFVVALGIILSFIFGLLPLKKAIICFQSKLKPEHLDSKVILQFFALTAFYELTQIIINNSDIILVKHYFESLEAGLYASLALIGRVVYFLTWIFVMILLPKVIQLHKDGQSTKPILLKYVSLISIFSFSIVVFTFLFPEFVVQVMFGNQYIAIAPLLWKYALATALFAISNVFAYYYLSLSNYIPVIISAILGTLQIVLITIYHQSLEMVVLMQQIAMSILLLFQLIYFTIQHKK